MPISPENAKRYPLNWKQIRARILFRAGNKCERCGVDNHTYGWRDIHGKFHPVPLEECEIVDGQRCIDTGHYEGLPKVIQIVLTVAHLSHVIEDCSDENLQALCQKCHLAHDQAHHQRNARATRRGRKAQGDLL